MLSRLAVTLLACLLAAGSDPAVAGSKLDKEGVTASPRAPAPPKRKVAGGYPLSEDKGFALRFYWLAMERRFADEPADTVLYTPRGFFLGVFPERFARALRMEGSGLLADGRVLNWAGRCRYGWGTCFVQLDERRYPFGRGARRRTLVPYHSVAVDPRLIPLGEPLYFPEFDGLLLPSGEVHDGCVRADDTGGNIKQRKIDFFVVSHENWRTLLDRLYGVIWITPHIETPRCEYLRD